MRKNVVIVLVITLVLAFIASGIGFLFERDSETVPFSLVVRSEYGDVEIELWSDNGALYAFLPSYTELSDVSVIPRVHGVLIDGKEVEESTELSWVELGSRYDVRWENESKALIFMRSANIPAMFINTVSGSMDYIHADKENSEEGTFVIYNTDSKVNSTGSIKSISGHGNSTWHYYDKKPYSLELNNDADLIHMGGAKRWVLLANATDETNLRNSIAFDFSRNLGLASPEYSYIDLYLNGVYAGLYLLCERNEINENRLELQQEKTFLVSLEAEARLFEQNYSYVTTDREQALRIHYSGMNSEELLEVCQSVENAIVDERGIDPVSGKHYSELIDVDSWARKYLVEEITGNIDACYISQFFYYDGDKLYAGPVWDYDMALGNKTAWQLQSPQIMLANRAECSADMQTPWFSSLYNKEEFYDRIVELYESEAYPLLKELSDSQFNDIIRSASDMNRVRWFDIDLNEETGYLRNYIKDRAAFLYDVWVSGREYHTVRFEADSGHYAYFAVYDGQVLDFELTPRLDSEKRYLGWYYKDTGERFDPDAPITDDVILCGRYEKTARAYLSDAIKLLPLAVFAMLLVALLLGVFLRNRRRKHEDK